MGQLHEANNMITWLIDIVLSLLLLWYGLEHNQILLSVIAIILIICAHHLFNISKALERKD